jgi:methylated-DNA-[protein]-cysteine S-methyltransferase
VNAISATCLDVITIDTLWRDDIYKQLAEGMGKPDAIRAIATAIGQNRIDIIVPCHRVLGSDGSLTGYNGGLHRKQALLA